MGGGEGRRGGGEKGERWKCRKTSLCHTSLAHKFIGGRRESSQIWIERMKGRDSEGNLLE